MTDWQDLEQASKKFTEALLEGTNEKSFLYLLVTEKAEKGVIKAVMEHTQGNKKEAAEKLGISRQTLRSKLDRHWLVFELKNPD